ncbi:MAG: hypothetical protein HY293_06655, partial [Planctomycetes bacterium]|nr:hypothetical protein [Planctomycetota bacterium]
MNCPKCNTPAAAGASHCKRCGAPLTAKAAAAASASGDIDLMPLEESKTPAFSPYEPPPDLGLPPAPGAKAAPGDPKGPTAPGDYVPKIRGANAAPKQSNLGLIVGGVILALIVGLVLWRVFRTENKVVVGNPKVETFVSLQPNATRVEKIEVSGLVPYTFDVEILDGE